MLAGTLGMPEDNCAWGGRNKSERPVTLHTFEFLQASAQVGDGQSELQS